MVWSVSCDRAWLEELAHDFEGRAIIVFNAGQVIERLEGARPKAVYACPSRDTREEQHRDTQ